MRRKGKVMEVNIEGESHIEGLINGIGRGE